MRSARFVSNRGLTVEHRGSGPAVVVISEIPGITPKVAGFGRRVAGIGCTAVLPHIFGVPGKPATAPYALRTVAAACVSREFSAFALRRTSPVTAWLRALARHEHQERGGPGVGVVGMCFTGGFALAMMVDDVVLAPVLSQPSLPFPITRAHRRDVGVTDRDLARVKQRAAEGVCVLGLRFTNDPVVPAQRFQRLEDERKVEIAAGPGRRPFVLQRAMREVHESQARTGKSGGLCQCRPCRDHGIQQREREGCAGAFEDGAPRQMLSTQEHD